jgi:hypothetical protein
MRKSRTVLGHIDRWSGMILVGSFVHFRGAGTHHEVYTRLNGISTAACRCSDILLLIVDLNVMTPVPGCDRRANFARSKFLAHRWTTLETDQAIV